MNFSDIRFGKASAEAESATEPDLLLDGYLDSEGLTTSAMEGAVFLFLGYKGSGKTALAEHLRLRSEGDPSLFVRHQFLFAFPYRSFQKIVSGAAEPESKYPTAWSWILLILLLDSFLGDEGIRTTDMSAFNAAARGLREKGLLPARNLHDIVVTSSKRSFKINLPFNLGFEGESSPSGEDVFFLHVVENLRRIVSSVQSDSRHLVIIDGLDEILSERDIQYQSLAALITEAMHLNAMLTRMGSPAKIIILCRTDLYERLPGPNKNKVRQDFATEFDWYHDPREPSASQLTTLANLRAKLIYPQLSDVFREFFPVRMDGRELLDFLLIHTRHTPRDFLQLLVYIQRYWVRGLFTRDQLLSGIRDYSINYFLPEIKDELVGYTSTSETDAVLKLIASLGKRDFSLEDLLSAQRGKHRHAKLDIEQICETLYECSAIGHIDRRPAGHDHFAFKFRNRHSAFNHARRILLHRGVWKAMNLI